MLFAIAGIMAISSCSTTKKKKKYVGQTYEEMKTTFPEADIHLVKDSIKILFPNNLVFDISKTDIKPTFKERLDKFSSILGKYNKTNLLITGYTDNTGEESENIKLSLSRATSVKNYLKMKDIDIKRLFIWGLGEKSPIASNETKEGRSKNRRVEFVVLYKP